MTSWDYYVGFEREPKNLDEFLDKAGFDNIHPRKKKIARDYESRKGGYIELFFDKSTDVEEGEQPDWKRSGYKVLYELMISTKDSASSVRAEKLAEKVSKKFNANVYDPQADEYYRANEI